MEVCEEVASSYCLLNQALAGLWKLTMMMTEMLLSDQGVDEEDVEDVEDEEDADDEDAEAVDLVSFEVATVCSQ